MNIIRITRDSIEIPVGTDIEEAVSAAVRVFERLCPLPLRRDETCLQCGTARDTTERPGLRCLAIECAYEGCYEDAAPGDTLCADCRAREDEEQVRQSVARAGSQPRKASPDTAIGGGVDVHPTGPMLSARDVEQRLGIPRWKVQDLVKAGKLEGSKVGPRRSDPYVITEASVEAYAAAHPPEAVPTPAAVPSMVEVAAPEAPGVGLTLEEVSAAVRVPMAEVNRLVRRGGLPTFLGDDQVRKVTPADLEAFRRRYRVKGTPKSDAAAKE
jgi:hypothetical protein